MSNSLYKVAGYLRLSREDGDKEESDSKDISRKVKSSVWARKDKGLFLASLAPYGYRKDPKDKNHLIIVPERAMIVKRIFTLFDNGNTYKYIADTLKKEKIYCPRLL